MTSSTLIEVGRFTYDTATNQLTGPRDYLEDCGGAQKDGERRALVVSLVDKEGYELKGRERTGRQMKAAC